MKVGLFDHIEHGERPTSQLFDERLTFIQAVDEAGFYCLHLAEHHQTPLNMVPAGTETNPNAPTAEPGPTPGGPTQLPQEQNA